MRRLLLGSALVVVATLAAAQEPSRAHLEGCIVWNAGSRIGARNECSRPVTILFMAFGDQHVVEAEVAAGGRFEVDTIWGKSGGFMFTACPVGTSPSVRFSLENKTAIVESLYNCLERPQA
jgi:hypothetical protein